MTRFSYYMSGCGLWSPRIFNLYGDRGGGGGGGGVGDGGAGSVRKIT